MKKIFTQLSLWKLSCLTALLCIFLLDSSIARATNFPSETFTLAIDWSIAGDIAGTVTNVNGESLIGVNVLVKGTNEGTSTDLYGRFELTNVSEDAVLVFSYIGYQTIEVAVAGQTVFEIALEEDIHLLKEVVVTGYGSQSRESVSTSISKLDTEVLKNVPYANVATALQGTLSGVRVQSVSGGQPGAAPRVIIRGGTSINNPNGSAPLYSVDGVIRSDLNNINPEDIESIQVLKDAASTVIYGARGSNGVVLVTTKSGKSGRTRVSYNYNLTFSDLAKNYDVASARDQIYFQRIGTDASSRKVPSFRAWLVNPTDFGTGNDLTDQTVYTTQYLTPLNSYKLEEGWESMPDPLDPSKTIIFKNTNFQDLIYQTGISNNHNISVSGGSDKATFSGGMGYLSDEGIAITTAYKRLSLNLNSDLMIRDNLNVFGRISYSNSKDRRTHNDEWIFGRFNMTPQTTKYEFEDGTLAPGANQTLGNPLYHLSKQVGANSTDNLTIIFGSHWKIVPGLSFEPQVSLFQTEADSRSFRRASFLNGPNSLNVDRPASGSFYKVIQRQADAVFTYINSFQEAHNLEAKAGFSYFERGISALNASGRGAATDLIPTLNASALPVAVGGSESHQVITGYFARMNYDFNQKYLLSLTGRYDGASNLGDNYKWGFFPGVSVGWNIHKEDFWKNAIPHNLVLMKLRASYGINGNISGLGDYQSQGEYSAGARYSGQAGIQNRILANPELKWEQSKTIDFGADVGLFNYRINFLFDYFRKETSNLLTNQSLPLSTGFTSILTNLGSLENRGFELELNANLLPATNSIQWSISLNTSAAKNKILKLPENGTENNRIGGVFVWDQNNQDYAWLGGLQEGGRLGDLFAYKQLSIYPTDADAAEGPVDMLVPGNDKTKYGGDVNWKDLDNNGIIDERDRLLIGNEYPDWTGGFSSSVSYKNFGFNVRMDYATGHTIYNYVRALTIGQFAGYIGISQDVLRSWQKEGDITDIPKYYLDDSSIQNNIFRGNSEFYEKADYLAIREVTLSYSLPRSLLQRLNVADLAFNITGNNLHYFTQFSGLNPEFGGRDGGRYPIPRNIILGARISF